MLGRAWCAARELVLVIAAFAVAGVVLEAIDVRSGAAVLVGAACAAGAALLVSRLLTRRRARHRVGGG